MAPAHPVPFAHCDLEATLRSPHEAREFVAKALSGRPLAPDLVYEAQLIASELVANAVLHARTQVRVGLAYDELVLLIAVADGHSDAARAQVGPGTDHEESGRGMMIVAGLAEDFGWDLRADRVGKTMWATLDLTGDQGGRRHHVRR